MDDDPRDAGADNPFTGGDPCVELGANIVAPFAGGAEFTCIVKPGPGSSWPPTAPNAARSRVRRITATTSRAAHLREEQCRRVRTGDRHPRRPADRAHPGPDRAAELRPSTGQRLRSGGGDDGSVGGGRVGRAAAPAHARVARDPDLHRRGPSQTPTPSGFSPEPDASAIARDRSRSTATVTSCPARVPRPVVARCLSGSPDLTLADPPPYLQGSRISRRRGVSCPEAGSPKPQRQVRFLVSPLGRTITLWGGVSE